MFRLVIDANVVSAYFREITNREQSETTASASILFSTCGLNYRLLVDKEKKVQFEWEGVVDREWFQDWFATLLIDDKVDVLSVSGSGELQPLLEKFGFPRQSRDIWYLRTLLVGREKWTCGLVSEDLDFYEPGQKSRRCGEERLKYLRLGKGKLRKALLRKGVVVGCIDYWTSAISLPQSGKTGHAPTP